MNLENNSGNSIIVYDDKNKKTERFFAVTASSTSSWGPNVALYNTVEMYKNDIATQKDVVMIEKHAQSIRVGTKNAYRFSYIKKNDKNLNVLVIVYIIHENNILYQITHATYEAYNGKQTREIFDTMLSSFKTN